MQSIEAGVRVIAIGLERWLMLERFQQDGMLGTSKDVAEMTTLRGRPLRSYADFAKETLAQWQG
jgi:hypothetical protein